jgi:maltose alpha-D-glucosyltransferase / alpha-amylase
VLIDFEGNPSRSLTDRRMKRSPLRDIAGMMQSFHFASEIALSNEINNAEYSPTQIKKMKQGAQHWKYWIGGTFLKAYFEVAQSGTFLPQNTDELKRLMNHYLLEKAIADLGKELNERSNKIELAMLRILELQ